jgi:hypothetical protein
MVVGSRELHPEVRGLPLKLRGLPPEPRGLDPELRDLHPELWMLHPELRDLSPEPEVVTGARDRRNERAGPRLSTARGYRVRGK